jgi:hypothetical protein
MKKITAILIVSGVLMLMALTVAYAAYPSLTTGYAVDSDYHGINVPPNTPVHVTAYTTDADVYQVTFLWKDPDSNTVWTDVVGPGTLDGTYDGKDVYTFASTHSPNIMGDWGVQALFQSPEGKTKENIDLVIKIKATSFFVIPDVPVLGTVGSLAAMLLGLGIYIKRKR